MQEEQACVIGQPSCTPLGEAASEAQHPLFVKLSPIPIPRGTGGIAPRAKADRKRRPRTAAEIMPLQPYAVREVSKWRDSISW